FRQDGYLFLLTSEDDWQLFQKNAAAQRALGMPVETLDPTAVQARAPAIAVDDVLGATFCGTDGHADPTQVCLGYASAARARGVTIHSGVTVTGLRVQIGRVVGVETNQGSIETPLIVNSCGPWAAELARLAG